MRKISLQDAMSAMEGIRDVDFDQEAVCWLPAVRITHEGFCQEKLLSLNFRKTEQDAKEIAEKMVAEILDDLSSALFPEGYQVEPCAARWRVRERFI